MTGPSTPGGADPRAVAELLAWCRRLSVPGPDTDPAQRAAYLTAKTDLLTRITNPTIATTTVDQHEGQR